VLKIVTGFVQPGLTGGSEDSYVRHMLIRARSNGWRVVVFNSRGCGDSPVTTPQVRSILLLLIKLNLELSLFLLEVLHYEPVIKPVL